MRLKLIAAALLLAAPALAAPDTVTTPGANTYTAKPLTTTTVPLVATTPLGGATSVGGMTTAVCVTPTITANTYSAGQQVGGLLTFTNLFGAKGSGIVQSATVTSRTKQATGAFRLYLFAANPNLTTWTDRTTPTINVADDHKVRLPIDFPTSFGDLGTHSVWGQVGLGQALSVGGPTIWGVLVTTTALSAFAANGDIQVCLTALVD